MHWLPRSWRSLPERKRFRGIGTLLFSDVFGLAGLAEGIDPLAIISTMSRVNNAQIGAVRAHGGTFHASQSDTMLAYYWPPSQVSPSHAEMAFECAGHMLKEIARLQTQDTNPPGVRIALGTGDLMGGRFQIVGPAYITAKQLMDLRISKTTSMLCTPATLARVSNPVTPRQAVTTIERSNGEELDVYEFLAADFH